MSVDAIVTAPPLSVMVTFDPSVKARVSDAPSVLLPAVTVLNVLVSVEERTPFDADMLVPARRVAKASTVVRCSVEPSESKVRNESPDAGVTALNSETSTFNVTSPLLPPPDNPVPAVIPVMSP